MEEAYNNLISRANFAVANLWILHLYKNTVVSTPQEVRKDYFARKKENCEA